MAQQGKTYPRLLLEEPGYPEGTPATRFIVALDETEEWGRILDREARAYYPTQLIASILKMTEPDWEEYTGPQDVLAGWVAAARDMEAELTPEQRQRLAAQRERQRGVTQHA